MAIWNNKTIDQQKAEQNNYKLEIFNALSKETEIADYSVIKKYFNRLYDQDTENNYSSLNSFTTSNEIQTQVLYASDETNKYRRLNDYRQMSIYPEIAGALDTLCYSADIPDENNNLVQVKINNNNNELTAQDIANIREHAQEYLDLFDFDNNLLEYFRKLLIEGQLCWENIIAKDELDQGIIGINIIPNEAYEFAYDMTSRKKIGIMIKNNSVESYNIVNQPMSNIPTIGMVNIGGLNLNCFQDLADDKVIVLPFEQLTYIDSGIYSFDNKTIYPPLERARRAYNQLMLIEDSVLIYRMVRAPEKWCMNVDIGRMGAIKGQQKVAQLMKQFGTKKTYDPATGTVGKTYDPMQMSENFWFVKSADSEGIKIESMNSNGANFDELKDLEYFLKKLYRSLNIPISRFFEANTDVKIGGADSLPSAEELHMAKFIMSLQKRFALGLLNGLITHLKLKGAWEQYHLKRSSLDIIFTAPIEYQQYRRSKLLESKLTMIKSFIGDEAAGKLFSQRIALKYFMGWDDDQINENADLKFKEMIYNAQLEGMLEKIKEGSIDISGDGTPFKESLKDILQKDILSTSEISDDNSDSEESSDSSESSDDTYSDDTGSDDSGGDDFSW